MQREFPTLYGTGAHGRTLSWRIMVQRDTIHIFHGELHGKQNEHVKTITETNTKSKRTPFEQAVFEAERKWKDQREKKNYVEHACELQTHLDKTTTDFSRVRPMLATNYTKNNATLPAFIQRKYDGVRCLAFKEIIAEKKETNVTEEKTAEEMNAKEVALYSRRGKPFHNLHHIRRALQHIPENVMLDGELYKDSGDFQSITGTARKKTKDDDEEDMYYVIYDAFFPQQPAMPFEQRLATLTASISATTLSIRLAPTHQANTTDEIQQWHDTFVADGFEGAIIRNPRGIYETDKRSKHLLKMKEFDEEEFPIVGFGESSGNDAGTVIWTVQTQQDPPLFSKVKHTGSVEMRRDLFQHGDSYIGQLLTVKFFGKTNDGNLRFPVGKSIRNYE